MYNKFIAFIIFFACCPYNVFACNPALTPTLDCVQSKTDGTYVAYFGYNNTSTSTISSAVGTYNTFSPTPANRGQPTSFLAGKKDYVFSVVFNGSALTWKLETSSVTASKTSKACVVDCKGTINGTVLVDACGVCGGDGSSCKDCAGVINGSAKVDQCGVCGGDNSTCKDCSGVPNGTKKVDQCGVCGGDNSTCKDCSGTIHGTKTFDACGVCGGDNSTCKDCAGIPNGETKIDLCGVCGGSNNTCLDCAGVPNGESKVDICGVCNGDGTSCLDCAGTPNGTSKVDLCGVCNGDNTKCADCFGTPNGHSLYDVCNVCAGDGKSCLDCAGVPNGTSKVDQCGVCNGTNTCLDCAGVPNGGKVVDSCGTCGGKGGKVVKLKVKKSTLISEVNSVVNETIGLYLSIGERCSRNFGEDYSNLADRLSKRAIVLIQNLKEKVRVCPKHCAKNLNKKTLKKINRILDELYQLSREVRHDAVVVCHGTGGTPPTNKAQFNSLEGDVNRCPNSACSK